MNWYKSANLWEDIKQHGPWDRFDENYNPDLSAAMEKVKETNPRLTDEEAAHRVKDKLLGEIYRRDVFTDNYGWSVPSEEAVGKLKEFIGGGRVVEVGSGYGLWAKLMQDAGINIVPTDTPQPSEHVKKEHRYTDIERIDNLEAVQKYGDFEVLMMVWPPYDEPMAYSTLKAFNGNKLIFIGESEHGCTGCSKFFNLLREGWQEAGEIEIPQWSGIHDYVFLYTR